MDLAKAKGLNIIDVTCPFVKVQETARQMSENGYLVIIGIHHPEVEGIKIGVQVTLKSFKQLEMRKIFYK